MWAICARKSGLPGYCSCSASQQVDRARRLVLVPEIDDRELVVRLALQQPAPRPGAQHLLEPDLAVAARQQQQEAEHPRRRRRDVGVVLVHPHPEVGVVERRIELDRFARAPAGSACRRARRRASRRAARATGRGPRRRRPCRTTLRHLSGARSAHASVDAIARSTSVRELGIERAAVGIELDAPPERGRGEHVAGLARRRAAGFAQLGLDLVEAGFEDEVVGADEAVDAAQLARRRRAPTTPVIIVMHSAASDRAGDELHVTLVRSCCLAAWRSSASAISRSSRTGILDAARRPHLRVHADRREAGDRVHLVDEDARRPAATAGSRPAPCRRSRSTGTPRSTSGCTSAAVAAGRSAGITVCDAASMYFAS